MAVMPEADEFRVLTPDNLDVGQDAAAACQVQHTASNCSATSSARATFGVAQVHKTIFLKLRMQHDIAETALPEAVASLRAGRFHHGAGDPKERGCTFCAHSTHCRVDPEVVADREERELLPFVPLPFVDEEDA